MCVCIRLCIRTSYVNELMEQESQSVQICMYPQIFTVLPYYITHHHTQHMQHVTGPWSTFAMMSLHPKDQTPLSALVPGEGDGSAWHRSEEMMRPQDEAIHLVLHHTSKC